jgi:hypothetical protein
MPAVSPGCAPSDNLWAEIGRWCSAGASPERSGINGASAANLRRAKAKIRNEGRAVSNDSSGRFEPRRKPSAARLHAADPSQRRKRACHAKMRSVRKRVRQGVRGPIEQRAPCVRLLRVCDPCAGAHLPALRLPDHWARRGDRAEHLLLCQLRGTGRRPWLLRSGGGDCRAGVMIRPSRFKPDFEGHPRKET